MDVVHRKRDLHSTPWIALSWEPEEIPRTAGKVSLSVGPILTAKPDLHGARPGIRMSNSD